MYTCNNFKISLLGLTFKFSDRERFKNPCRLEFEKSKQPVIGPVVQGINQVTFTPSGRIRGCVLQNTISVKMEELLFDETVLIVGGRSFYSKYICFSDVEDFSNRVMKIYDQYVTRMTFLEI